MNIYSAINTNKLKSVLLIIGFLIFVAIIGYVFGELTGLGYFGLILAVVLSMFYTVGSYYYSDQIVLRITGAKPVKKEEYPYLFNTIDGLSIAAGIPVPKAYVIEDPAPNAFATGRDPQHGAVAVTTGLLKIMNRQELEGVIAHEMSHIKNYDTRLMTLAVVLAGVVTILADIGLRAFVFGRRDDRGKGGGGIILLIFLVMLILSPIFAQLIKLAISRKREYLADANGALLTRYPEGLASALEKISQSTNKLKNVSEATAHLYISNPFKSSLINGLFSTHPPMQDRIKILRGM
ncbi:zinc metalloprotease HtpX [Candidatus Micrarchaeota archaeon]|nr:zinc metalloprotease HtpX [Candidatus Micrarchaeota archaeon]